MLQTVQKWLAIRPPKPYVGGEIPLPALIRGVSVIQRTKETITQFVINDGEIGCRGDLDLLSAFQLPRPWPTSLELPGTSAEGVDRAIAAFRNINDQFGWKSGFSTSRCR